MKRLAVAVTALGFLCGLTSCGNPHDAEPATTGGRFLRGLASPAGAGLQHLVPPAQRDSAGRAPLRRRREGLRRHGGTPRLIRRCSCVGSRAFRSARRSIAPTTFTGTPSTSRGKLLPHSGGNFRRRCAHWSSAHSDPDPSTGQRQERHSRSSAGSTDRGTSERYAVQCSTTATTASSTCTSFARWTRTNMQEEERRSAPFRMSPPSSTPQPGTVHE